MVIGNCSSILIKRNKQMYNSKSSHLKACNSYYNGLIHHKAVGVEPAANSRSVLVVVT